MKIYLVSLAAGGLAGILYGLLQVRSPAPPAIALVGLLGMLVGEQVVPAVQRLSHLPIFVDPSHGTGKRNKVTPLSRAAVAVGADGLMVEHWGVPDRLGALLQLGLLSPPGAAA